MEVSAVGAFELKAKRGVSPAGASPMGRTGRVVVVVGRWSEWRAPSAWF